jgi:hypothetical protein
VSINEFINAIQAMLWLRKLGQRVSAANLKDWPCPE